MNFAEIDFSQVEIPLSEVLGVTKPAQIPNALKNGQRINLEFAQSESLRRASVVDRGNGALGPYTRFQVAQRKVCVYDKDISYIGGDCAHVLSYHAGL